MIWNTIEIMTLGWSDDMWVSYHRWRQDCSYRSYCPSGCSLSVRAFSSLNVGGSCKKTPVLLDASSLHFPPSFSLSCYGRI